MKVNMTIGTLKRLKNNPHYKLTEEQLRLLAKDEQESSEFGVLPKHNTAIPKHPVKLEKKAR